MRVTQSVTTWGRTGSLPSCSTRVADIGAYHNPRIALRLPHGSGLLGLAERDSVALAPRLHRVLIRHRQLLQPLRGLRLIDLHARGRHHDAQHADVRGVL